MNLLLSLEALAMGYSTLYQPFHYFTEISNNKENRDDPGTWKHG